MADIKFIGQTESGYDGKATPRWQMVPNGGYRDIAVHANPAATKIQLKIVTPAVLKLAAPEPRPHRPGVHLYRLEGIAVGPGLVEASDGQAVVRLQVSVKLAKAVAVKFFFVEDSHTVKGKSTASSRTTPDLKKLLAEVNKIYEPQTNITFKSDGKLHKVRVDLGADGDVDLRSEDMINKTYMTKSKDNTEWHAIAKHADPDPKLVNVFFCPPLDDATARETAARNKQQGGSGTVRQLWGLTGARTKMKEGKDTHPNRNVVVLSEEIFQKGTPEFVLAHELGHYLGAPHPEEVNTDTAQHAHFEQSFLMWGGGGPGGTFISRDEANAMNPSGI
jgi:hypothetical protein